VLFLPPALHFVARLVRRLTPVPELTSTPLELEALAQATLAAAAVIAVPCFASRRHGKRLGIAVAAGVVGAAAVLIRADWETAARVAAYGFGVALPMQPWAILVYLLAFGAFTYTVVTLWSSTGPERLRGYGLALYGLAGLDYQAPFQMALSGLGFLCLLESVLRPTEPPMAREAFENLVRRAAASVGAPQVTLTGHSGYETARVHSPASEPLPVALMLTRAAGQVTLVDIVVGERVPRDPPFSLERRDAGKLGPRADGVAIETGEPAFDATFATRDRRGLNAQLLDDATRARLNDSCRGWIGVWPQRGVHYRAQSLAAGEDALPVLIALFASSPPAPHDVPLRHRRHAHRRRRLGATRVRPSLRRRARHRRRARPHPPRRHDRRAHLAERPQPPPRTRADRSGNGTGLRGLRAALWSARSRPANITSSRRCTRRSTSSSRARRSSAWRREIWRSARASSCSRGDLWRRFGFGGYGSDAHERADLVRVAIARGHAHERAAGRTFAREEIFVIGDTPRDISAAHAAGATAIAVATGAFTLAELQEAGADAAYPSLKEWLATLEATT
jgi:hypothetical protein